MLIVIMSTDELLQAKINRLEELRKYQSYYGPNTPYPVIVEINELEAEIHRMTQARAARKKRVVKKKKKKASPWRMSQATFDIIATIAFIGLVFLLGSILFAAYVQTRPGHTSEAAAASENNVVNVPTLRPTFTPTSNAQASELPVTPVAAIENPNLPSPNQESTPVPTRVATLTPSPTPRPTETPAPTETPVFTDTPPPPPALPTATPGPPTATPAPSYPFQLAEQGNRAFQKTTYHGITIYVAVVSEGNIPLGGYKVVGDHVPSGAHAESGPSDWNWSVVNCLDCDYIKQGNLKFEPGTFSDGIWNIYLTDSSGAPLSPVVSLQYSSNPDQWVWDFIIFKQKSG